MRIDRYGEEFVGCVACNRWGSSSTDLFMELSEDDLHVLADMMRDRRTNEQWLTRRSPLLTTPSVSAGEGVEAGRYIDMLAHIQPRVWT